MVSLCRRSCKPIDFIFIPSIMIFPSFISKILNKPADKLLFPAPVLPTIPIFNGKKIKNIYKVADKIHCLYKKFHLPFLMA